MNSNCLKDLFLDRCTFSKSGYSLEFSGNVNGTYKSLKLSTSYNLSTSEAQKHDLSENVSLYIWKVLEAKVRSVKEQVEECKLVIEFDNNISLFVWSDEPAEDNLAIIMDTESSDWIPLM